MLNRFKRTISQTPLLGNLLRRVLRWHRSRRWGKKSVEEIFTDIFRNNAFGGTVSVSGGGSDLQQTARIIAELPVLFDEYQVRSMLDIPCGDFYWMSQVNLQNLSYTGADIVRDLIEQNRRHATEKISFQQLNLITDLLPKVDLVFCRDCLVHLSFDDVLRALRNIRSSGSRLLFTTTFPAIKTNRDIRTGEWRALNFQIEPFNFPTPIKLLEEGCTENENRFVDKSLGLWRISDLEVILTKRHN